MRYNHTQDKDQPEDYRCRAQVFLQQRIDKNIYVRLMLMLRHQNQYKTAERYQRESALLVPRDPRFSSVTEMETGGYRG